MFVGVIGGGRGGGGGLGHNVSLCVRVEKDAASRGLMGCEIESSQSHTHGNSPERSYQH